MINFIITTKDGKKFLEESKDKNEIHQKKFKFNNTIYDHHIVYGCLIIIKLIKQICEINQYYSLYVRFINGAKFDQNISVIKKNKKIFLNQNHQLITTVELSNHDVSEHEKLLKDNNCINKKNYIPKNNNNNLFSALKYLSRYVGCEFPGNKSIILEIKIIRNEKANENNNLSIYSFFLYEKLFLIKNYLFYKNIYIEFITTKIPELKIKYKKIIKKNLQLIQGINKNLLIIGASSGIGNDLLKVLSFNKKIKIFATYYKNKIDIKKNNIFKKKINLLEKIDDIFQIIKKNYPLNVYYFATPKILISYNNRPQISLYKKYYIEVPKKIIKFADRNKINCNIFIPSTIFINKKVSKKDDYTNVKLLSEKILKKAETNFVKVSILRVADIYTKNNLSITQRNLPYFRDILFNSKNYLKKLFII
jgi:hypothetical protein